MVTKPFMKRSVIASALVTSLLSACAVGPDYKRPALDLPVSNTGQPASTDAANTPSSTQNWWLVYNDSVLNQLMDEALKNNYDIALAAARVTEARAQLGVTEADQTPTAYLEADRSRNRSSAKTGSYQSGFPLQTTSNRLTLNVSYEIDFWGKYRRATEAARADLIAIEANRDAVRLSMTTQIAQSYFAVLALEQEVSAAKTVAERGRQALDLQKMRFDAGLISEFDYQLRAAEVDAVLARLPVLDSQRSQQERVLNVLLGRSPRAVLSASLARPLAQLSSSSAPVVADLPSEMILQRPDVRAAEQQLIATNARIGVARAAYFPSISLTGLFGGESQSLSDLFSGPARIWNYAGNLVQPLWTAGKVRGLVNVAKARNEQALAQYQSTIANAFREAQDAINAQSAAREVAQIEQRRSIGLGKSWELAKLRYDNGVASQLDVIDVERNYLQARINYLEAERQLRASIADMYKALGATVVASAQ